MRVQEEKLIVTFHTTAAAMQTEKCCLSEEIAGRLIPLPRSVSADCGIAWSCSTDQRSAMEELLNRSGIEYAGIYEAMV